MRDKPRRRSSCTGCLLGVVLVVLVVVFWPAILMAVVVTLSTVAVFLERLL